MNKAGGHLYRAGFSLVCWAAMGYLFWATRGSASRLWLLSGLFLTMSFSIFTLVIWWNDRRRSQARAEGSK